MMLWRRERRRPMAAAHRKFQDRAKAARRRPWRLLVALAAIVVAAAGVVYLFWFSPAFVVEEVRVEHAAGPEVSPELGERALELAAVPTQVPLARVDTAGSAERVLSDLRVEQVQVRRDWPRGIVIEVTPRTPAAVVMQGGTPTGLADADGLIFDEVDAPPEGLVQVRVSGGEVDPREVAGAVAVHQELPEELAAQVPRLTVARGGVLRFPLGGATVIWGPPTATADKAVVLTALLEQDSIDINDSEGPPLTIDLSVPTLPVLTGLPEQQD